VAYDGQTVTFFDEQRLGQGQKQKICQQLPVLEFIHGVVRHIPPKQFKMVRYYGLYAPCKAKKLREKMGRLAQALGRAIYRLGWRQRIRRDFKRDPLRWPRCGQAQMELFSLTIRCGHRLVTFGGLKWLLARGSIVAVQDPDPRRFKFSLYRFSLLSPCSGRRRRFFIFCLIWSGNCYPCW
jgi:hypothetical protein